MAYNKKVIFQVLTEKPDKIGNQSPAWEDFFTAWANVNSIGGREYYAASQVNSQNDVVFRIRYSKKIAGFHTSEVRISYNGKIYDIKHIEDYQEQHRELVFRTEERNGRHD